MSTDIGLGKIYRKVGTLLIFPIVYYILKKYIKSMYIIADLSEETRCTSQNLNDNCDCLCDDQETCPYSDDCNDLGVCPNETD